MHDAIQDNVGVSAGGRADQHSAQCQRFPGKQVREYAGDFANGNKETDFESDNRGGADVAVQERVNRVAIGREVVERFEIDKDVSCAEGEEAQLLRGGGVQQCAWTEVKWCYGHEGIAVRCQRTR